jgi:hypothetical protein
VYEWFLRAALRSWERGGHASVLSRCVKRIVICVHACLDQCWWLVGGLIGHYCMGILRHSRERVV